MDLTTTKPEKQTRVELTTRKPISYPYANQGGVNDHKLTTSKCRVELVPSKQEWSSPQAKQRGANHKQKRVELITNKPELR